jgi:hypothetical protein
MKIITISEVTQEKVIGGPVNREFELHLKEGGTSEKYLNIQVNKS